MFFVTKISTVCWSRFVLHEITQDASNSQAFCEDRMSGCWWSGLRSGHWCLAWIGWVSFLSFYFPFWHGSYLICHMVFVFQDTYQDVIDVDCPKRLLQQQAKWAEELMLHHSKIVFRDPFIKTKSMITQTSAPPPSFDRVIAQLTKDDAMNSLLAKQKKQPLVQQRTSQFGWNWKKFRLQPDAPVATGCSIWRSRDWLSQNDRTALNHTNWFKRKVEQSAAGCIENLTYITHVLHALLDIPRLHGNRKARKQCIKPIDSFDEQTILQLILDQSLFQNWNSFLSLNTIFCSSANKIISVCRIVLWFEVLKVVVALNGFVCHLWSNVRVEVIVLAVLVRHETKRYIRSDTKRHGIIIHVLHVLCRSLHLHLWYFEFQNLAICILLQLYGIDIQ